MTQPHPSRRGALAATIAVLTLLALLPARWGGSVVNSIGDKAFLLVGPVTAPVYSLVRWATPAPGAPSEEVAALRNDVDKWKKMYLDAVDEARDARRKLEAMSKSALLSEPPKAQLLRPVIGTTAEPGDVIIVRAGKRDGVEINSVATTPGVQLIGRVIRVDQRICNVRLITTHASGPIRGVIMVSDTQRGLPCMLSPVTGGVFQGLVTVPSGELPPVEGQLVRLDDPSWPRIAQNFVVGTITRVQPDSTGRPIVTVRPTVDLDRVAEVVLRISQPEPDEPASTGPPGSTDGSRP